MAALSGALATAGLLAPASTRLRESGFAHTGMTAELRSAAPTALPARGCPRSRQQPIRAQQQEDPQPESSRSSRRELVLNSTSAAVLASIFHFSGERPKFLGVQKDPPSLALCPATPNCISTSEEANDPTHYVPPWTYNPSDGRGMRKPASQAQAMAELVEVVEGTRPDKFVPTIITKTEDYLYVEYESPTMGFVDDVEFWFPPGTRSLVEYRSASRLGESDLDANRKRIRTIRKELEKKGWESVGF